MTRRRFHWRIWTVFLAAAVILAGLYYYGVFARKRKAPVVYSVILYQNTLDEWGTLVEGMVQAEEDLNIHVNYVYLAKDDTALEQAAVIRRELRNGSSGILLAVADSQGIQKAFETTVFPVPVICVETGAGKEIPVIRSDDRAMGRALGEAILADMDKTGNERRVTVIKEYAQRDSIEMRYQGLAEALEEAGEEVVIEERMRQNTGFSLGRFLTAAFYDGNPYLVTLDKYITEQAALIWSRDRQKYEKNGATCKIFGIGNTARTVNALDNGNIEALVYQNEFNMGYQAVACLAEKRKKDWIEENVNIGYGIVTRETLYEDENQRLLFSNT